MQNGFGAPRQRLGAPGLHSSQAKMISDALVGSAAFSLTNLETSTRQTFGSRNRSLYSPCGVHTQYRRPSRYEARAAHVIQPRTWLPCPGMNSRTCNTSPRAPQSRNFLACSEVIVAVSKRCHQGSRRVHSPSPAGFMAKTCLWRSWTNGCHHCFSSPGTKQTYQAAASRVTGAPFSSNLSSIVSMGDHSIGMPLVTASQGLIITLSPPSGTTSPRKMQLTKLIAKKPLMLSPTGTTGS